MKLQLILYLSFILTVVSAQVWILKSPMPTARSDHTANTVGDLIYLVGGCSSNQTCPPGAGSCFCQAITNSTEAYSPATDTWTILSDMPRPRYRHGAATIGSKLYVVGGRDLADNIIQQVDVYDIPSDTWTEISDMYTWVNATSDMTVSALGTKLYVIGGYTQDYVTTATTWVLDTSQTLPSWVGNEVPLMSQNRGDACAVSLDNMIYVYGGFSDTNFCAALDELELYNPDTNSWHKESSLHFPRGDSCCAVLHGKFHAIGGEVKDAETNCSYFDVPTNHVEYYDPDTGLWYEETPIPYTRFRFAAASWQNYLYVFGGQGGLTDNQFPLENTVLEIQDTTPVASAVSVTVNVLMLFVLCMLMF